MLLMDPVELPHVQIYNFDTAWRTGPEVAQSDVFGAPSACQVSVFAQPTPSVEVVWQAWQTVLSAAQMPRPKSRFGPSGFATL